MKKLYIKPQIEETAINVCTMVCDSLKFNATKASEAGVTSADARARGDYEVDEEPTFGDLW